MFTTLELSPRKMSIKIHYLKGVSVGANSTIICGITIIYQAITGSVVNTDVNPLIIVGNPEKQIGWMSEFDLDPLLKRQW